MPDASLRPLPADDLDISRLTPAIGAVVRGLDPTGRWTGAHVAAVRAAVREHQVVFVRDLALGEDRFRDLAARFGRLAGHPVAELSGTGRDVSVIVDSAERPPAGFPWHTDLSWTEAPPSLGILSALTIPPVGGDTLWASGPAMYDRLAPPLQDLCCRLRVVHAPDERLLRSVRELQGPELVERLLEAHPPVEQPLVRVDADTGRRALWISPLYATRIVGMDPEESDALLALLHGRADDPEVQVRWRWREGDLAVWDEASTCHRALTDHHPHLRRMRRATTAGERPLAVADAGLLAPTVATSPPADPWQFPTAMGTVDPQTTRM